MLPSMPGRRFICTTTGAELEQKCDRHPGARLVFSICFSHLPSPHTCDISIPHTQGKLLLIPLYSYTQLWSFSLKKGACLQFRCLLTSLSSLTKAVTNKGHNLQPLNKRFWPLLLCLLETLNLADNKLPDCPWGTHFWLFKNTLPNGGLFLSHIHILLG